MSDPLRDVERAIERLGRCLVTGGEELPEEVVVPAVDLATLLAFARECRGRLDEDARVAAYLSERYGLALPAGTTIDALCGRILRGCDTTTEAPGRREGEPGA